MDTKTASLVLMQGSISKPQLQPHISMTGLQPPQPSSTPALPVCNHLETNFEMSPCATHEDSTEETTPCTTHKGGAKRPRCVRLESHYID